MKKVLGAKLLERTRLHVTANVVVGISAVDSIVEVQRLMQLRQFSASIPMIDRLLHIGQDLAELWRCKGISLGWSGDHRGALTCFDNAIDIDDSLFTVWYQKGVALTQLERYEETISAHLRAQELYAFEPSVAFNLGQIFAHLQRHDEALVQLDTAAKLGHPRAADSIKLIKSQILVT